MAWKPLAREAKGKVACELPATRELLFAAGPPDGGLVLTITVDEVGRKAKLMTPTDAYNEYIAALSGESHVLSQAQVVAGGLKAIRSLESSSDLDGEPLRHIRVVVLREFAILALDIAGRPERLEEEAPIIEQVIASLRFGAASS